MKQQRIYWTLVTGFWLVCNSLGVLAQEVTQTATLPPLGRPPAVIHIDVVALDEPLIYNRFGSINPYGMIYALARDVQAVPVNPESGKQEWTIEGLSCEAQWQLKSYARPRPLVLRGNVGDTLEVKFINRLLPFQPDLSKNCRVTEDSPYKKLLERKPSAALDPAHAEPGSAGATPVADVPGNDWPKTRNASFVIQGLTPLDNQDARCTGLMSIPTEAENPKESEIICRWKLERSGTFMFYSSGAPGGGEGDGGSLVQGLFGTLNVEPEGSQWYRSQVTQEDLDVAWPRQNNDLTDGSRASALNYTATYNAADESRGIEAGDPVLNFLKPLEAGHYELIYSDLNAIIHEAPPKPPRREDFTTYLTTEENEAAYQAALAGYQQTLETYNKAPAFREFTAIFHDELKTFYADAFRELEEYQLEGVGDGFGINYGASGMGSILLANRKGIGASWNCVECMYEEFFLQSWANGDPALLEQYRDDPANVFHSYLNDRVVFRNLHAGPKETHVFHLHSHQWLSASDEDRGSYLDSQTIAPLQGFAYGIYKGGLSHHGDSEHDHTQGSGNRNRTPGDSIFHCHLYPHFAQGMWALWRVHDVLEDGSRTLPDGQPYAGLSVTPVVKKTTSANRQPRLGTNPETGENRDGTPVPAVVPLPTQALPPLPTYGNDGLAGYPFYIPGQAGHRAPQPPLDFARNEDKTWRDGGLPRHVVLGGERGFAGLSAEEIEQIRRDGNLDPEELGALLLQRALALGDMTGVLEQANILRLNNAGEASERRAMAFHAGTSQLDLDGDGAADMTVPVRVKAANGQEIILGASMEYSSLRPEDAAAYPDLTLSPIHFQVNKNQPHAGAPYADPCGDPDKTGERVYHVSAIRLDMVVNNEGWHDPQARINVLDTDVEKFEDQTTNEAEPFFFRAASGECIIFYHTNRTSKDLPLDDFQMKTPTDIIGQHIHLVKFDVTSSDGSANGFNYEDGTLAADAVLERKCAMNAYERSQNREEPYPDLALCNEDDHELVWEELKKDPDNFQTTTQRWFSDPILSHQAPGTSLASNLHGQKTVTINGQDYATRMPFTMTPLSPNHANVQHDSHLQYNTNVQDHSNVTITPGTPPTVLAETETAAIDRTMRTVFTHDHFAPSSIQQHGFYSALLIEPAGSIWCYADRRDMPKTLLPEQTLLEPKCPPGSARMPTQAVGPRALILNADDSETHPDHREFALAIADFALLYEPRSLAELNTEDPSEFHGDELGDKGMNQLLQEALVRFGNAAGLSVQDNLELQDYVFDYWSKHGVPVDPPHKPEAISKNHHNPYLVNYNNEPIPLRIGDTGESVFADRNCGASWIDNSLKGVRLEEKESVKEQRPGGAGDLANVFSTAYHGDPCTPVFEAYEGERVQLRLIQGAQEVQHMFSIEGLYWKRLVDYTLLGYPSQTEMENEDNSLALVSAQEIGISEHFEMTLPAIENISGNPQTLDYLYHFGTADALWNGAWGLLRVYNGKGTTDPTRCQPITNDDDIEALLAILVAEDPHVPTDAEEARAYARLYPLRHPFEVPEKEEDILSEKEDILYKYCRGDIGQRLAAVPASGGVSTGKIEVVNQGEVFNGALQNVNVSAPQNGLEEAVLTSCPGSNPDELVDGSRLVRYEAAATRYDLLFDDHLEYAKDIYDPDALFLLPLKENWRGESNSDVTWQELKDYLQEAYKNKELEPFVLRVNAGDCVVLEVYNALLAPGETLLPDESGDALMPTIVPLNVDTDAEHPELKGVQPSANLSLSLPMVASLKQLSYGEFGNGLAVGLNSAEPTLPPQNAVVRKSALVFYAGLVEVEAQEADKSNCQQEPNDKDTAPYCVKATPYAFGSLPIKAFGDIIGHGVHGLMGAVIVEPKGATVLEPETLTQVEEGNRHTLGLSAVIRCQAMCTTTQKHEFREFVVLYQDGLNLWHQEQAVPDCAVCDDSYDLGEKGLSYRSAPFWARLNEQNGSQLSANSNLNQEEFNKEFFLPTQGVISTPTFVAKEGEEVRFRVLQPTGRARQRTFTVYGYDYTDMMPSFGSPAAALMSVGKGLTATLGGPDLNQDGIKDGVRTGCYLYRDGPAQFFSSGVWGSFVVTDKDGKVFDQHGETAACQPTEELELAEE